MTIVLELPHISLSSGGGFRCIPISTRDPLISCRLGLYVPRVARLLRAITKNAITAEIYRENTPLKIYIIKSTLPSENTMTTFK